MMRELLDEWPQVVKFVCLSVAVLMAASSAASLTFGYAWMAAASAVVSAWSLSVCLDVWRAEIVRDLREGDDEARG